MERSALRLPAETAAVSTLSGSPAGLAGWSRARPRRPQGGAGRGWIWPRPQLLFSPAHSANHVGGARGRGGPLGGGWLKVPGL